jgi:hypothetical protein
MCGGKHRRDSDSERLSFEPKAHQPLAELIFLSLASEKEESRYVYLKCDRTIEGTVS